MQCVWETESTKTQIHWGRGREKGVLDGERLGTPGVYAQEPSGCGQRICVAGDLRVLLLGMGGLVPLSFLSPSPSPGPLRGRTFIIESTFQYLFAFLLLLWVAITVYIICLSVLPGRCSLLAEWFEEWEGGEKGQALTLCCHRGVARLPGDEGKRAGFEITQPQVQGLPCDV